MSTGARVTLGVVCLLTAGGFAVVAALYGNYFPKGPWPFYGLAGFCALISLACLVPASRPIAMRVIGAVVCVTYALYLYDSHGGPDFWKALAGFGVFGMPGGYVALTGKYPGWGKAAGAFGVSPAREEDREAG